MVPVLFTMLGLLDIDESVRMHVAVGTSLASIIITSLISARSHHRRGAVDTDVLKKWAIWILTGSVAGTLIAGAVDGPLLSMVFAFVALAVALYMAATSADFRIRDTLPSDIAGKLSGFVIGGLSAMMGIGGGTLCVPYFNAFGFPVHRAVGPDDGCTIPDLGEPVSQSFRFSQATPLHRRATRAQRRHGCLS